MSTSDLKISVTDFVLKSSPGNVKELLLPPEIKENSTILKIKPNINLTKNALHRNGRTLKNEILKKSGNSEVVILQIGDAGIDNEGRRFLIELNEALKSKGKILILLIEDEVSFKDMNGSLSPILVSSMTDAEKATSRFAA